MRVVALKRGEKAPGGADRVMITQNGDGEFQVDGDVSLGNAAIFHPPTGHFPTESAALNSALAWAQRTGARTLYLERPKLEVRAE